MNARRMSSQEVAKTAQAYQPKPVYHVCGNCAHFRSKTEQRKGWGSHVWVSEFELRCGLGGFKVGKSATCERWEPRPAQQHNSESKT